MLHGILMIPRKWKLLALLLLSSTTAMTRATEMACEADGTCEELKEEKEAADDFVDPCRNSEEEGNCPGWAASGECKKNPSYMHSACAKSCGVCTEEFGEDWHLAIPSTITCQDLHEMCPAWAKQGECLINPSYMTSACKKSCMLCLHVLEEKDEETLRRTKRFMSLDLGSTQRLSLGKTDAEQSKIKSRLKRMDKYSKTNLTMIEDEDVRQRCRNDMGECAYWAAMGHCLKRPGFMIATCPLACLFCAKTSQFHRCTGSRHPKLQPAAFDGAAADGVDPSRTMNAMFSRIHQEGKVDTLVAPTETKPKDPWILRWDSLLSDEQVQALVDLANSSASDDNNDAWKPSPLREEENFSGNPTRKLPRRVSSSRFCGLDVDCDGNENFRQVLERISILTGISISHFETASEFTRYAHFGDSYGVHHDFMMHDTWKPSGPRVLTLLLFLSQTSAATETTDAGGALGFPHMEWLVIKPKTGQAVLWPNVENDDVEVKDDRMVHEMLPLAVQPEEPLLTLTVWIHLYDYAAHVERDCV